MSRKAQGQVRRSQIITTYGPGALIDLPRHSAIVGGLETWPKVSDLDEVHELRAVHLDQLVDLEGHRPRGLPRVRTERRDEVECRPRPGAHPHRLAEERRDLEDLALDAHPEDDRLAGDRSASGGLLRGPPGRNGSREA